MLSFIRVGLVMVSVHINKTLTKKLLPGMGNCYDKPDHAFVWKNVDLETLDLESNGML